MKAMNKQLTENPALHQTIHRKILAYLRAHQEEMTASLVKLVELESPSSHKLSLDILSTFLFGELGRLGAQAEILRQSEAGNHVIARWGEGSGGVLMLCHMDTVWDVGTLAARPLRTEEGKLYGPGTDDMKSGIVIAMWAIRALRELGLMPEKRISLLLNSDEEIGSRTSRDIIENEARTHEAVFVLEPAEPPGHYKTQRKGVGEFCIKVTGLAAHAGASHANGVNAIEELAYQILTIQSFTDYETGTTLNVGEVGGGTRSNVVPAEAWANVDVRITKMEEGPKIEAKMKALQAHNLKAQLEVTGGINRPPMIRTAQTAALFARAREIAAGIEIELGEASTGGASDGNFTAALGIPTLDGMGAVGGGAHALHEHVVLSSLPERAALLAAMLRTDLG